MVQAIEQEVNNGALNELDALHQALESTEPRLFLLLPSDLKLWDNLDPSTHSFHLYFLCDCPPVTTDERFTMHAHVSNHPGYDLDQPQEFIRRYDRLSLTILEAVKAGYISDYCCIPKLDSFQILTRTKLKLRGQTRAIHQTCVFLSFCPCLPSCPHSSSALSVLACVLDRGSVDSSFEGSAKEIVCVATLVTVLVMVVPVVDFMRTFTRVRPRSE